MPGLSLPPGLQARGERERAILVGNTDINAAIVAPWLSHLYIQTRPQQVCSRTFLGSRMSAQSRRVECVRERSIGL
jgi:hypothetical protein